jgi:hypothetical protein
MTALVTNGYSPSQSDAMIACHSNGAGLKLVLLKSVLATKHFGGLFT